MSKVYVLQVLIIHVPLPWPDVSRCWFIFRLVIWIEDDLRTLVFSERIVPVALWLDPNIHCQRTNIAYKHLKIIDLYTVFVIFASCFPSFKEVSWSRGTPSSKIHLRLGFPRFWTIRWWPPCGNLHTGGPRSIAWNVALFQWLKMVDITN